MRGRFGVGAQPDQPGDLAEDVLGLSAPQRAPGDRHEEPVAARRGAEPIPCRDVGAERGGDRRVQGDQPYPVELGVPDRDHALDEVDVAAGRARTLLRAASRSRPAVRAASGR